VRCVVPSLMRLARSLVPKCGVVPCDAGAVPSGGSDRRL
jgi:hypothetical protein